MILMLLAGAGVGLGVLIVVRSLRPAHPDLGLSLQRLGGRAVLANGNSERPSWLVGLAKGAGLQHLINRSVATDLRLVGRAPDAHLVSSLLTGAESALIGPALLGVLALGGVTPPVELSVALTIGLGVAGALLPNITLHAEATKRRRSFTHALSAFLDLVAVNLAAGRGIERALDTASAAGHGWAFTEIRQALYRAKVMGETPWAGLDQLGEALAVTELRELAASVSLGGDAGAKVRASL